MRMELLLNVEVDADYIPGTDARPVGDGTWEPGEGGMAINTKVTLDGIDITDGLDPNTLGIVEEAWLENYETHL